MESTVAITGASGSIYAQRTLVHLASGLVERINLILSTAAETVAQVELGVDLRGATGEKINAWIGLPKDSKLIRLQKLDNMAAGRRPVPIRRRVWLSCPVQWAPWEQLLPVPALTLFIEPPMSR